MTEERARQLEEENARLRAQLSKQTTVMPTGSTALNPFPLGSEVDAARECLGKKQTPQEWGEQFEALGKPANRPAAEVAAALPWLPAGAGAEEFYQWIRGRLLAEAGTGLTFKLTPAESLRKSFQKEEVERMVAKARELDPLARRVLRLVESIEGDFIGQKAIAERFGRSTSGNSWTLLCGAVKALEHLGWVEVKNKVGIRTRLREQIAEDLTTYRPSAEDVQAVYQNVLHQIATGAAE